MHVLKRSGGPATTLAISKRWLSAQEAAVALRPFYFAVHPDRFATMPDVRQRNEKALQIFNGYLNDLYPRPSITSGKPIQVVFSIKDGEAGELKDVNISLVGNDPTTIVRKALESCKLSTSHVKDRPSPALSHSAYSHESSSSSMDMAAANLWRDFMKKHRKSTDTASILKKRRDEALEKAKQHQKTRATLRDEIEDIKWRTGCKEVIWQMEWAESNMRRCLSNLHRVLDLAGREDRATIVAVLLKNTIRFGRGSHICCDGSVQFGADNVPEQWQRVCAEAAVRRNQMNQLKETKRSLSEMLGGAEIVCPPCKGLPQTLQQLQSLAVRISNRPDSRKRLAFLGGSTMVEVVTSYDELSMGQDGRLFVPCNVDIHSLEAFLEDNVNRAKEVNQRARSTISAMQRARDTTCSTLGLAGLDWEECLQMREVLAAIERLEGAPRAIAEGLRGLHVRLSANPTVHVRNDGSISLPLDWS